MGTEIKACFDRVPSPEEAEIERLHAKLREVTTYVHELHLRGEADGIKLRAAARDLEQFAVWLAEAEDERADLRSRLGVLESMNKPGFWGRLRYLCGRRPQVIKAAEAVLDMPGRPFRYYLKTSPFRVYRDPTFNLEGWVLTGSGEAITGLRARVDGEVFLGTYGIEEPPLAEWHGVQANNPNPGFKIVIETPQGRHRLRLEAQLGDDRWFSIFNTPIWVRPN